MLCTKSENPLPGFLAAGLGNRRLRFLTCFSQRREHDRQPATFVVVVVPVSMMAVIVNSKHRAALYLSHAELVKQRRENSPRKGTKGTNEKKESHGLLGLTAFKQEIFFCAFCATLWH